MTKVLLVLLPLTLFAQSNFGPLRLDDELDEYYYYPAITLQPDGSLLCVWASASMTRLAGYGQRIAPDGTLLGARIVYEENNPGEFSCAPQATITRLPDVREGQLFYHS